MAEKTSDRDFKMAQADLIRAITELRVATKYKKSLKTHGSLNYIGNFQASLLWDLSINNRRLRNKYSSACFDEVSSVFPCGN